MPETLSHDRRKVLSELGAKLDLTPADEGQKGAIKRAEETASAEPQRYFLPLKFVCRNCMWDHMDIAGPELRDDTEGTIHISLSEVATVESISGVSRFSQCIRGKMAIA
jgi:cysteine synthase A